MEVIYSSWNSIDTINQYKAQAHLCPKEHIRQAIQAEQWDLVEWSLRQNNWVIDPETALMILRTLHVKCNLLLAQRMDFTPTHEHVWIGLNFIDDSVRYLWAKRRDYIPTETMTLTAITDSYYKVRNVWSERTDIHISRSMQDIALKTGGNLLINWLNREDLYWTQEDYRYIWRRHREPMVRIAVILRKDFVPKRSQLWKAWCFDSVLRIAFWYNHNWKAYYRLLKNRLLMSRDVSEIVGILQRRDWELDENIISIILRRFHHANEVLQELGNRPDFFMTRKIEKTIDKILRLHNVHIDSIVSFLDIVHSHVTEDSLDKWLKFTPELSLCMEKKRRYALYAMTDYDYVLEDNIL